jgi:phage shock protein A
MGLFGRIARLFRANANAAISAAENPALILDQAVEDMQADLVKLRQAVATAIASQKRLQQQWQTADENARTWYERAEIALQKGEEDLAREALARRKAEADSAATLKASLAVQEQQVTSLRKSLAALEGKIAEARTKKEMLKARHQAAEAQQNLQGVLSGVSTDGAMAAFQAMEEKVLQQEARGQALAELAGSDLESQFARLDECSVDDELAALKGKLSGTAGALPPSSAQALPAAADDPLDVLFAETAQHQANPSSAG